MFACLYSLSAPQSDLVKVAQDFTPRFETIGPLVMLDLSGLSRLFGSAREIGEQIRRSMGGAPVRIAIASSQTAAALLALGRPGLTVVSAEEQPAAIAPLPVSVLGELETSELASKPHANCALRPAQGTVSPSNGGGGWMHPRDTHGAQLTKRARRGAPGVPAARVAPVLKDVQTLLDVLRRWGVKTLGALAALPAGDVYERIGARGVTWQRLARGDDQGPLVPCVPEDPFEGTLDLEWPIEGLEPLSFVLARLFEPLAARLERADRGAAILHTHLRLTTREVHARTVQLPAPMRDPKTLRTLVLLDLESNPPSAAIDRVRVLVEPTPAKVLQWTLYERAQPSPEQVSTLVARLTALMGEGHVGSPKLVDSWKPGAFEMAPFAVNTSGQVPGTSQVPVGRDQDTAAGTALRRFRLPIPARVQMQDGRPARVLVDRRGVTGGAVEQSAGPWRTSGEWWNDGPVGQVGRVDHVGKDATHPSDQPYQPSEMWDRDEWDVLLDGGAAYRLYVERTVGQWFIEGVLD